MSETKERIAFDIFILDFFHLKSQDTRYAYFRFINLKKRSEL